MEEEINEVKKILEDIIAEIDEKKIPKAQRESVSIKKNKNSISFFAYGNILLKLFLQKDLAFEIREISQDDIVNLIELEKEPLKIITLENFVDKFSKASKRNGNINYIKCNLENIYSINKVKNELKEVYYYLFLASPVDSFGCCSRYNECSNVRECINPDKKMAQGCQYKENLKKDRVFYGRNRNV